MKKTLVFLLAFVLVLVPVVNAEDITESNKETNPKNQSEFEWIDDFGYVHHYYNIDGTPIKIQDLESNIHFPTSTPQPLRGPVTQLQNDVSYSSGSIIHGTRIRVTPYAKGPATITYLESVTTNSSFSIELAAELKTKIFNIASAKLQVNMSKSSSISKNFATNFPVPSGKYGAVFFTPYICKVNAVHYDSKGAPHSFVARFPKVINQFTDGYYELITK